MPAPTLLSPQPASDDELALRCMLDTAERSAAGLLNYPCVWLALVLATKTAERWPMLAWGNLAALSCVALVRVFLARHIKRWLLSHRMEAERAFISLTLGMALYWGVLTAICMFNAPGQNLAWIMLLSAVTSAAGGNTLLGIHPKLRHAFPMLILAPVILAELMMPTTENMLLMAIEVVLVVYLYRTSAIVSKDYWDGRQAQRQSEKQARELELASLTDALTQVPNRSYFDRHFAYEWARQCRHGGPISVMIVDIDHFKQVNDTHGHPVGDVCLKAVAQALLKACNRSTDCVARIGGEEFAVLLADTDSAGALVVAERMLQRVRELHTQADGSPVSLTCSIGLTTTVPYSTKSREGVVEEADRALYRAKNGGRNKVFATDTSGELPPLSGKT